MENTVFIETFTSASKYDSSKVVEIPLECFVTYCVYKYCAPTAVSLKLVSKDVELTRVKNSVKILDPSLEHIVPDKVPWQVSSCIYPVVLYKDCIITGLCAVARHICKYKTIPRVPQEHEEGLLGFRKSCLQAPNEASTLTKFCEVDIIKTTNEILLAGQLIEVPINLVRFENHLKRPVRVHNVYKIVRDMKKEELKTKIKNEPQLHEKKETVKASNDIDTEKERIKVKQRKWKSNKSKNLAIDCSLKIEDLQISHQYTEGPFFTLADLILLPTYHIIMQSLGDIVEELLPLTYRWYKNITDIPEVQNFTQTLKSVKRLTLENVVMPEAANVSLYKCDPKRHNPKKRLFTKEDDIENALSSLWDGMELIISPNEFQSSINWNEIPDGANPHAGHLPKHRVNRKAEQLENLILAVLSVAQEGDLIVDFCSGGGHLGITIAYLLPKCTVILLENKEQSLLRARERVHEMGLQNVLFFQCNLDFFIGKFDLGVGLHACGVASDLVLDKCLKANAKFVLCPCCYGSIHETDRFVYPRSSKFSGVTLEKYLCISHAADQTHQDHPLTGRGARCMAVVDSDRLHLAAEFGYTVTLSKLKPLTCSPKNNLLIGVPA